MVICVTKFSGCMNLLWALLICSSFINQSCKFICYLNKYNKYWKKEQNLLLSLNICGFRNPLLKILWVPRNPRNPHQRSHCSVSAYCDWISHYALSKFLSKSKSVKVALLKSSCSWRKAIRKVFYSCFYCHFFLSLSKVYFSMHVL